MKYKEREIYMQEKLERMAEFAREVLVIALDCADEDCADDLADRWEHLTGDVYGTHYCRDKVTVP